MLVWMPCAQVLSLKSGEAIAAMLPINAFEEGDYLLLLTRKGKIKKLALSHFQNMSTRGLKAMRVQV